MTDNEWNTFIPRFYGDKPDGVSIETHEIEYKWSHGKYFPLSNVNWDATTTYRYRPRVSSIAPTTSTDHYTALRNVLDAAYNQAAHGKGAERHADGKPWTEQPIFTVAGQVGDGFNAGQAIKKIQEAQQMAARGEHTKAMHEVLGAIVYAASLHVLWEKEAKRDGQ